MELEDLRDNQQNILDSALKKAGAMRGVSNAINVRYMTVVGWYKGANPKLENLAKLYEYATGEKVFI